MQASVFGTRLEFTVLNNHDDEDRLLTEVARKREERDILRSFICGSSFDRCQRIKEIYQRAKMSAADIDFDFSKERDRVVNRSIGRLRETKTLFGVSTYTDLLLRIVLANSIGRDRKYIQGILRGKTRGPMPRIADRLKAAEGMLLAKIRSDVGPNHCRRLLEEKEVVNSLREIAKDLFFAVNSNLDSGKVVQYMSLMYELRKRQVALPTNYSTIRQNILRALSGDEIRLIHLKCPRYAYPGGRHLTVIDHLGDEHVSTKAGEIFLHPGENELYERLGNLLRLFEVYDIPAALYVLVMDQDLEDHFPVDSADSSLVVARFSLARLKDKIKLKFPQGLANVDFLREYLSRHELLCKFDCQRLVALSMLRGGISQYPEGFVESSVDYRTQANNRILAENPGRQFARDRAYAQLATLQAIGVLAETGNLMLIEEDRGEENTYIGGVGKSCLPVYFTKLRNNPV